MDVVLSNTSGTPYYQQIYDQLVAQILRGELAADEMLPSIRLVAKELRVSVITVKKAWEELERAGFLYTVAGKGCFVRGQATGGTLTERRDALAVDKLKNELAYYRSLGFTQEELLALVRKSFDGDA